MSGQLRRTLYLQDLDLCAALYEQRLQHLEHPGTSLTDLAEIEARLDAHVDGLARGRDLAAQLCLDAIDADAAGQVHAAARVLCRGSDPAVLSRLEQRLADDPEVGPALGSALSLELSGEWAEAIDASLDSPSLGPLLVRACGDRKLAALADALTRRIVRDKTSVDPVFVWALGKLRHRPALELLQVLLGRSSSARSWSAIAIACLELGDRRVARLLETSEDITRWSPLGQVLSFDVPRDWLLAELDRDRRPEVVVALALRGSPASLRPLIELLGDPALGGLAAGALFVITGAPLVDADDPARLCRDAERWRAWVDAHAHEWTPGQRRRLGAFVDMPTCAAAALCCAVPVPLRRALFDELALRHDEDTGLRPDGPARPQLEQLKPKAARAPKFDDAGPSLQRGPLRGRFELREPPRRIE